MLETIHNKVSSDDYDCFVCQTRELSTHRPVRCRDGNLNIENCSSTMLCRTLLRKTSTALFILCRKIIDQQQANDFAQKKKRIFHRAKRHTVEFGIFIIIDICPLDDIQSWA
jgi:hypothetical protein